MLPIVIGLITAFNVMIIVQKFMKGKFYPGGLNDLDPNKEGDNKRRTFYDHYNNEWSVFILKGR